MTTDRELEDSTEGINIDPLEQKEDHDKSSQGELCIDIKDAETVQSALEKFASSSEIPEEVKRVLGKVAKGISVAVHSSQTFSGPLPPPEILSKFNEAVPGLANKIIDWAETEGNHRRLIETKSLDAEIKLNNRAFDERRLGQIFGFLIGTIAIVAGSVTAILGSPIAGTLIGGSGVVGLVSAFLYSKRKEERSSHAKNDDEQ